MEITLTPLDILYWVLSVSIAVLAILLSLAIYNIIKILRNVNRVTSLAENTVELVNHYLWQPIKFMNSVMDKAREHMGKASQKSKGEK